MFFVSRRRHNAELTAAKAEAARLRTERDQALRGRDSSITAAATAARLFAEADATNTRLAGRNRELSKRLDSAHDGELINGADILRVESRLGRALKACARYLAAYHREQRRSALLQARLDDAVGLSSPAYDWRPAKTEMAKENAS